MEQRIKFIEARLSGEHSMVTLCRMFGISTKTGYKWWHRFEQEGMPGLFDQYDVQRVSTGLHELDEMPGRSD